MSWLNIRLSAILLLSAGCSVYVPVLDSQGAFCGEKASFSPDGRRVAFERVENHRHKVGVVNLLDGKVTWLYDGPGDACQPAWGPDGSVVFTAGNPSKTAFAGKDDTLGYNLWVWKDGVSRRLTGGKLREYCASVAPDGGIYFVSEGIKPDDGDKGVYACNRTGIGRLDVASGRIERVTVQKKANTGIIDPQVSPDGSLLLRAEVAGYGFPWRIVVSPLSDPECRTFLTGNDMVAYAPTWSPDGKMIAFTGCREGDDGWQIYLMQADGGKVRRLAKGANPSFSPDGTMIVYDYKARIFVRNKDKKEGSK